LSKARINQREREGQLEQVMAGHFFDGNQIVGRIKEAEAAVTRASAEVDLSLEELQAMQARRQTNRVTAAHRSRVLKVMRHEGSAIRRGDAMILVERMDERVVQAFLRQDEVTRVAIGDDATVFVPALRARARARVVQVERNAAFLDDIDSRYTWRTARDGGPKATDKDRTARVTLQFEPEDRTIADRTFDVGTPLIVSFARRSVNTVFSSFADLGQKP
jgi:acetyl/propionyl-CoA carboxylase alpha subunit